MNCFTFAFVIVAFCYLGVASGTSQNGTLVLVHTLFRHGNRTPDGKGYTNNPINESYYAEGYSQLSNEGKRTEYKIGTTLRQRYNNFLGQTWNINYLEARSTNVNRTKMSLGLMLAGLYPPSGNQTWLTGFNWQPIPYNYLTTDKELFGNNVCSNYTTQYDEVFDSDEIQNALSVYNDVFTYISEQTGEEFSSPEDIFGLYFNLLTQQEYGYPLENWTTPVFPDIMEKITKDVYYIGANTTGLKQFVGGLLLKKILSDSKSKIDGTISPATRKMFIYSAHERNVANLLLTLGVFDDKIPSYGSHILIELHLINRVYGFKVFYQDWNLTNPRLLVIPGCTAFCPYNQFAALLEEVIPADDAC